MSDFVKGKPPFYYRIRAALWVTLLTKLLRKRNLATAEVSIQSFNGSQLVVLENELVSLLCPNCDLDGTDVKFTQYKHNDSKSIIGQWYETDDGCLLRYRVSVNDSGTYTCINRGEGKILNLWEVSLMVLRPETDEPTLNLRINSRKTAPQKVTIAWSIVNVKSFLQRRVTLQSYVLDDDTTPEDLSVHVNSTKDLSGMVTYNVEPQESKRRYARLDFRYINGYNKSIEQGLTHEEIKVANITFEELLDRIILHWFVTGAYENEKLTCSININGEEDRLVGRQFSTQDSTVEIKIKKRPLKLHAAILPTVGNYTGVQGDTEIQLNERGIYEDLLEVNFLSLRVACRNSGWEASLLSSVTRTNDSINFYILKSPQMTPTEVRVDYITQDQVQIQFVPIANIEMYGEDTGCKVEVCERRKILQWCTTGITQPGVGKMEFNKLLPSKMYMARVSCSTNGGFGPPSDWITFNTTAITAFKDGTGHESQVSESMTLYWTDAVILGTAGVFANRLGYL